MHQTVDAVDLAFKQACKIEHDLKFVTQYSLSLSWPNLIPQPSSGLIKEKITIPINHYKTTCYNYNQIGICFPEDCLNTLFTWKKPERKEGKMLFSVVFLDRWIGEIKNERKSSHFYLDLESA